MGCTNSNAVSAMESKGENNNFQKDNQIQNGSTINDKKAKNKLNSENLYLKQNNLQKEGENPFKKENKEIPNKKMQETIKEEKINKKKKRNNLRIKI